MKLQTASVMEISKLFFDFLRILFHTTCHRIRLLEKRTLVPLFSSTEGGKVGIIDFLCVCKHLSIQLYEIESDSKTDKTSQL